MLTDEQLTAAELCASNWTRSATRESPQTGASVACVLAGHTLGLVAEVRRLSALASGSIPPDGPVERTNDTPAGYEAAVMHLPEIPAVQIEWSAPDGVAWNCFIESLPTFYLELLAERDAARSEVRRLKRGDFTPDEFQALCHHRDEKAGCTRADFEAGCRVYQESLFGKSPVPFPMVSLPSWIEDGAAPFEPAHAVTYDDGFVSPPTGVSQCDSNYGADMTALRAAGIDPGPALADRPADEPHIMEGK
jgi:hypothetical protein